MPRRSASGASVVELMPDEPEAVGLLALMLLTEARRPAADRRGRRARCSSPTRTARCGTTTLIAEGHALVRACLRRNAPGPFQIQAAINAVHTDAPTPTPPTGPRSSRSTTSCSPCCRPTWCGLNRAVAVAEVEGPLPACSSRRTSTLDGYHAFHVVRADLLARLGRPAEAAAALERGRALTANRAEARLIDLRAARHEA